MMNPELLVPLAFCLIAAAIGSIPFDLILQRLLEDRGRWTWYGWILFSLNAGKGAAAIGLAHSPGLLLWEQLGFPEIGVLSSFALWAAAFAVVLGHVFSPWKRFHGGRGITTALGTLAVLSPMSAAGGVAGFLLAFFSHGKTELAALFSMMLATLVHLITHRVESYYVWGGGMIFLILLRYENKMDEILKGKRTPEERVEV